MLVLVLVLKEGEAVHIGGYLVIVVRALEVGRTQIKFGIEAPRTCGSTVASW